MSCAPGPAAVGVASLPMYDFPELRGHTDALWDAIAVQLRALGVDAVPRTLTRPDGPLVDHWLRPDLLLSHTCGYPVVRQLPGIHVLGSFSVVAGSSHAGHYRSVVVARGDDRRVRGGLAAFEGASVAANDDGSLSGWVSLGWALAEAGIAPGQVTFTGQHALSVAAVRDRVADLASIDAHTYGLFCAHRADAVAGLVVVGHGPEVAVTPLVTARGELVDTLRSAVAAALVGLSTDVLRALMITGWVPHDRTDHEPVLELARKALSVLPPR